MMGLESGLKDRLLVEVIAKDCPVSGGPLKNLITLDNLIFYVDRSLAGLKLPRFKFDPYKDVWWGVYSPSCHVALEGLTKAGLIILDESGVHVVQPVDSRLPKRLRGGLDNALDQVKVDGKLSWKLLAQANRSFMGGTIIGHIVP